MNVISLIAAGRSGVTFLHSLLDSHPNCCTIPGSCVSKYYSWYKKNKSLKIESLIIKFIEDRPIIFDIKNPSFIAYGFNRMGKSGDKNIAINKKSFFKNFNTLIDSNYSSTSRDFFIKMHLAYAKTIEQNTEKINTIVYNMHFYDPQGAKLLVADFPNTKFIHVVRDPIQAILSLINHYYGGNMYKYKRSYVIEQTFIHFLKILPLVDGYQDKSRFIKLEDLHLDSERTMGKLIKFLDVDWNDCLLKSTFNGLMWWNLAITKRVSGFNKETIKKDRHLHLITKFDRKRLLSILSPVYDMLEYKNKIMFSRYLIMLFTIVLPFKFEILGFISSECGQISKKDNKTKSLMTSKSFKFVFSLYNFLGKIYFVFKHLFLLRKIFLKFLLIKFSIVIQKKSPFFKFIDLNKTKILLI